MADARPSARQRGYTWKWEKARAAHLSQYPLCVLCAAEGRVTPAKELDHITPHRGDQALFWDEANWQGLCKPHHTLKTIIEDGGLNSGAMTHPEWLPPPGCKVTLVTGPPGAGKTTWCQEHATPIDEVIDLDECFKMVCGVHGHDADRKHLKQAIRLRNKLIAGLAAKRRGEAFLIVASPSQAECDWWVEKLGAQHLLIDPGQRTCEARTEGARRSAVGEWYRKRAANDWQHPGGVVRKAIGEDGWPIEA